MDPHFLRHEAGKMTAALARVFGWHNLAQIEDIVQDTLLGAVELWAHKGTPPAPGAWLMLSAKRRAIDVIRHKNVQTRFAPEVDALLRTEWSREKTVSELLEAQDSELAAIFACASAVNTPEVQVALILKILCGFSSAEIAHAFMEQPAAIDKRIIRGKHALEKLDGRLDPERLPSVQQALYLLFSEGYHSTHPEQAIREDLCFEALRLVQLLCGQMPTASNLALSALLCLQAARIPARMVEDRYVDLEHQDRSRFNRELIAVGAKLLQRSMVGEDVSTYHLEAKIAWEHCSAPSFAATDWPAIVRCYETLCDRDPSPILALNHAIAVGQSDKAKALAMLATLEAPLASYPFLFAAQARLSGDESKRQRAIALARTPAEREFFRRMDVKE